MDQLATLEFGLGELRREVHALDASDMGVVTNCDPWTIEQLGSHALNNQLLWAGLVTGERLVTLEDTMGAVPYDGDLATYADEVAKVAMDLWRTPGLLTA